MKNKIAKTEEDFALGILKGKTVFPFGYPGQKQMTMNTPAGVVPYPIEYVGLTNGQVTDKGIAKPGDEFVVNGDTVIEKKLNMKNYNDVEIDGEIARLKAIKKALMKKYQSGGYAAGPIEQMGSEEAMSTDRDMYRDMTLKKKIAPAIINQSAQYSDLDPSFVGKKPIGNKYGYDVMQDEMSITDSDQMTMKPSQLTKTVQGSKTGREAVDSRQSQNYTDIQSLGNLVPKTASGNSSEIRNYFNETIPGLMRIEGRELDMEDSIGEFGPEGVRRLRQMGFTDDEIGSVTYEDLMNVNNRNPVVQAVGQEVAKAKGIQGKKDADWGLQGKVVPFSDEYGTTDMLRKEFKEMFDRSGRFMGSSLAKKVPGLTESDYDMMADRMNQMKKDMIANGVDPTDPESFGKFINSGKYNDVLNFSKGWKQGTRKEIGRQDLVGITTTEREADRRDQPSDYSYDINTGKKLTYAQAWAKAREAGEPGFTWEGKPYTTQAISPKNAPEGFYDASKPWDASTMRGRQIYGEFDNPGTMQPKASITPAENQAVKEKLYNINKVQQSPQYKMKGGYLKKYQEGNPVDPFYPNTKLPEPSPYSMMNRSTPTGPMSYDQRMYNVQRSLDNALNNVQTPVEGDHFYNPNMMRNQEPLDFSHMKKGYKKQFDRTHLPPRTKAQKGLTVSQDTIQQRDPFAGSTNPNYNVNLKKLAEDLDKIQWDEQSGLPIEPDMNDPYIDPILKSQYNLLMQRIKAPEYTDNPDWYLKEKQAMKKRPIKQAGGYGTSYMGGVKVGDEMSGNTAPSKYFDNTRNYKSQPGISDFMGATMFYGQTGGNFRKAVKSVTSDVDNAQSAIRSKRMLNEKFSTPDYEFSGIDNPDQMDSFYYSSNYNDYKDGLNKNNKQQYDLFHSGYPVNSDQKTQSMYRNTAAAQNEALRDYELRNFINKGTNKYRHYKQTGGYVDNVYPTLADSAKTNVGYGRNTNYDWNLKEVGGYGDGTDPYKYQTGGKAPKYKPGQVIQYKSGGKIKTGVVKRYLNGGKIELE